MKTNIKITGLLAIVVLMASCSAFKSSVKVDMQAFSDNTNILFNEAAKVSRPFQFKTLSTYNTVPEYADLNQKSAPLIKALKGIVYYSNQIVAISNSSISERGKNEQLAIYLEDAFEKAECKERLDSIGLSHGQIELTINRIKEAESFRKGIEDADPIIKTIVLAMFERLDEVETGIDNVIIAFNGQIYNDFEFALQNYRNLKELRNQTQQKMTQLYYAQAGETAFLDTLIYSDNSLLPFFTDKSSVTQENYDNAEKYLFKRLENIDVMLDQLDDDKIEYMDMKKEIGEWHVQVDEKISIARNSLIVWSQSHKNLGKGIETPPLIGIETFISLLGPAVGSATKVAF